MMKMAKMALIYDFDKTLSPKDMQEFGYIQSLGFKDPAAFWKKCAEFTDEQNCDSILSYMYMMTSLDPKLTREQLISEGKKVKLYRGVESWFDRINEYGRAHHIEVEHYIISSGLKDIIMGTAIADKFKKIYACSFAYSQEGKVLWPTRVVNYTTKTQYIFRINKGVLDEKNDFDLNRSTPDEEKYIPYERMIYFGDGLTDVPSMKVVGQFGGYTIAVYGEKKKELAMELHNDKRAAFAAKADYSAGSRIEKIVCSIIDNAESSLRLEDLK